MRCGHRALIVFLASFGWSFLPKICVGDLVSAGDVAFIGFNTDGLDDFAIVLLSDAAVTDVVYFNDNNWDGTQFIAENEGNFSWSPGAGGLAAGTVVTFNAMRSTPSASAGMLTGALGASEEMSLTGDEAIYAYLGSDFFTPTTFLAAVSNDPNQSLANTGLSYGTTAALLPDTSGNNADGGQYTGPRSGEATFNDYVALIGDTSTNWSIDPSNGTQFVPFNSTPFQAAATATPEPASLSLMLLAAIMGGALCRKQRRELQNIAKLAVRFART